MTRARLKSSVWLTSGVFGPGREWGKSGAKLKRISCRYAHLLFYIPYLTSNQVLPNQRGSRLYSCPVIRVRVNQANGEQSKAKELRVSQMAATTTTMARCGRFRISALNCEQVCCPAYIPRYNLYTFGLIQEAKAAKHNRRL